MGCLVLTTSNCKAGRTATVLGHLSRLLISTMTAMPMLSSAPRSLVAPMYIMGWLRRPYQLQLLMLRLLVRPRDFASPMTNLTWDHRLPASATSTTMVMMMWRLEHLLLLSVLFLVTSICAMMMPPLNISATISIQTPITVQASSRSPHLRGEIKTARSVILVLLFPQLVTSMATPMLTSSSELLALTMARAWYTSCLANLITGRKRRIQRRPCLSFHPYDEVRLVQLSQVPGT